jgi:microcystin-dependent protein
MWPTTSAPTGYLICDGSAVSRTTYSTLYAVISTTFGVGDGSTTFNLPNYTNRMPYGTTIGATGGSADAVVVSHTHTATVTDPGHFHNTNYNFATYAGGGSSGANNTFGSVNNPQTDTKTTGISVANSTTGVSGTNANLPPYLGINFIIKT